ncbi:MAG: adenylyl-sulfate kinase [Armatimonadetes bacterium]|nr:adenylyl-sulfate kinase [Armatimonadota bacterium]
MKSLLRVATAGSVDDGKSTLIGRLLLETDSLLDDQLQALEDSSRRRGSEELQLALVTDGLRAEREQNITIDVAFRTFYSRDRRIILADSPGHVEYTRNMVTGASTADVVIVLADAFRGETVQSRRHLAIASLLRTPLIVLAINKMDLVGYDQQVFDQLRDSLVGFATSLGANRVEAVPISALVGDNVCSKSEAMPWYTGDCLLDLIDQFEPESQIGMARLAVQSVLRAGENRRYYAGSLVGGSVGIGDTLRASSGNKSVVEEILVAGDQADLTPSGSACAVRLADELDISRGDWLSAIASPPTEARTFHATLFWLQPEALRLGMTYQLRQGPRTLSAKVTSILGQLNFETGAFSPTGSIAVNDVCRVEIELAQPAPLELFADSRDLGGFVLVDPRHQTVAAGCIEAILEAEVASTAKLNTVLWLTGLSGAGKSTLATAITDALLAQGVAVMHLDGDLLRSGLCSDLGFTDEDRRENVRRTAEVAKLFAQRGTLTICSLISPSKAQRDLAREILGDCFVETYVRCGLDECIRRDPKGLYARAISGAIPRFTGISDPYEAPETPELVVDTERHSVEECVRNVQSYLRRSGRM